MTDAVARISDAPLTPRGGINSNQAKAHAVAQSFEATFLNSMFQFMFTDTDGEGPMSGGGATGIWRSFLTQEYSKSIAKAGGIGLANHVYASLMAHQEVKAQ
ncbi:MAG TPA: rod-binding protein [Xanthobacteraceae bacterium]|nr:rod-binding protein [Xanthobacteraceae bacterium]